MRLERTPLHYSIRSPKVNIAKPPLLVLLHGAGENENSFSQFINNLDDRLLIVSARAPFELSQGRYLWFNPDRRPGQSLAISSTQAEHSRQMMLQLIEEVLVKYKANPDLIYLLGFSQGAVIALHLLLSEPKRFSGVVALSGQILPDIRPFVAQPEHFIGIPVFVAHGLKDEYYPIEMGYSTRSALSTLPLILDYQEYSAGHYLTKECLADAMKWLTELLDVKGVFGIPDLPDYQLALQNVSIKVRNLDRAIAFYVRFLGMKLVERTGNAYAFLSNDDSHHVIVLQNIGMESHPQASYAVGVYRVAFEVPDQASFARVYQTLKDASIEIITVDHLISWSIYFNDSDGNGLEIFWDTRHLPGRSHLWQGRDLPLDAEKIFQGLTQKTQGG